MARTNVVLDRLKKHYGIDNNTVLANLLKVSPQTISNWYARKTFDLDKIIANCPEININWLVKGEGPEIFEQDAEADGAAGMTASDVCAAYDSGAQTQIQTLPLYEPTTPAKMTALLRGAGFTRPVNHISLSGMSSYSGAIYIRDNAMGQQLRSGDIALFEAVSDIPDGIVYGQVYLLTYRTTKKEVYVIRRVDQGSSSETICLSAPSHMTVEVNLSEIGAMALIKTSIRHFLAE